VKRFSGMPTAKLRKGQGIVSPRHDGELGPHEQSGQISNFGIFEKHWNT
jgi:hypothetical protein